MVIQGLNEFVTKHCETGTLKRALDYHGLYLSEEMLFGLGGGAGFIYWYMKMMPGPFVGTRYGKVPDFLIDVCRRIGAAMTAVETASPKSESDNLMEKTVQDLQKPPDFLSDVQQSIIKCLQIERKAFETLSSTV